MALFGVTAVRFDQPGEVARVLWARVDGATNKLIGPIHNVDVDRLIKAFNEGDTVVLLFETEHGRVSGGRLRRKVLPTGRENVIEDARVEGRTLKDLPTF